MSIEETTIYRVAGIEYATREESERAEADIHVRELAHQFALETTPGDAPAVRSITRTANAIVRWQGWLRERGGLEGQAKEDAFARAKGDDDA